MEDTRTVRAGAASAFLGTATLAMAMILAPAGSVRAQSTSGMIHGQAPAGDVIVAKSTSGMHRKITVGDSGKYKLRNLPLGVYSVTLMKDGKVVDKYHRVPLTVGRGMEVNFACPHDHCEAR